MPAPMGTQYWRERAEEARTQANDMRDPGARQTLLEIADNYEQLADQAERMRLAGIMPGDKC